MPPAPPIRRARRYPDEECRNPPSEPLPTGEKILLGVFLVAGAAAAIVVVAMAAEAVIPVVIASIEAAGAGAASANAFYYANAIAVNEIGLFAAGLIIGCDGDVAGLLRAIASDPAQAAQILAEVYILHVNIKVAGAPARKATVPVKLLPPDEQTNPKTSGSGRSVPPLSNPKRPRSHPSPVPGLLSRLRPRRLRPTSPRLRLPLRRPRRAGRRR